MTVAFDIPNPFARRYSWGKRWSQRPALITIWHVDPCRGGDENSCDWHGTHPPLLPTERAIVEACWDVATLLDNRPHYPDSPEHKAWQPLREAITLHTSRRYRRWWHITPRWHVWHWRVQIRPVQTFKRWAFSRCATCGLRFSWGYAPVSPSWNGEGPRWFRGEPDVYHDECWRRVSEGQRREA